MLICILYSIHYIYIYKYINIYIYIYIYIYIKIFYFENNYLMEPYQSAYRTHYSTENALNIISKCPNITYHIYAEDIQQIIKIPVNSIKFNLELLECASEIINWLFRNDLL